MMRFKSLTFKIILVFLVVGVVGCGLEPVNFRPQFYAHDYINHQIIINEKDGYWFQDGVPQKKSTIRKYYETRRGMKP